jgi:glycosyltransferase involved in cell wall biosynthesis
MPRDTFQGVDGRGVPDVGPEAGTTSGTGAAPDPLVSIVTPSLNQRQFIEAAIESVRAQDYPRIEHIVVDGASSDGTLEVLARYSPPLRWVSEPDAGQGHAINRGFRMASGEILSWLNADDVLRPGAVRAVVDAFRSDAGTMMVYGDGDFVDVGGRDIEPFRFVEPFHLRRLIEVHDYILQPAAFVRRDALEDVGYVDETLNWSMDWDLWIRIGRRFRVRFLPVPLATVRLHPDTKTSRAGFAKLREMYRIVRRHSRRRLPPVLVIHGGGTLYRIACEWLGQAPLYGPAALARRDRFPVRWAYRLMDRLIETGQLPWERADPAMRRPVLLPGAPTGSPGLPPPP